MSSSTSVSLKRALALGGGDRVDGLDFYCGIDESQSSAAEGLVFTEDEGEVAANLGVRHGDGDQDVPEGGQAKATSVRIPEALHRAVLVATDLGMDESFTAATVRALSDRLQAFARQRAIAEHFEARFDGVNEAITHLGNRIDRVETRLDAKIDSTAAELRVAIDFTYSQLRMFGDEDGIGSADVWEPKRLRAMNYIDAMALIRRGALLAARGFSSSAVEQGWEDYDLWCRFAELGFEGVFLPELLCEYRVHGTSMLRTRTNNNHLALTVEMRLRHPNLFQDPLSDSGEQV